VGWEGEMMMMDGLVKNFDKAWFLQFAHHLEFFSNGLTIDETLWQTPHFRWVSMVQIPRNQFGLI
jgi:hypothetical protein